MARRSSNVGSVYVVPSVALCQTASTPAALAFASPSAVTVLWWDRSTASMRSGVTTGGTSGFVPPRLTTLAVAALAVVGPHEHPYLVAFAGDVPSRTLPAGPLPTMAAVPFAPSRTVHHSGEIE